MSASRSPLRRVLSAALLFVPLNTAADAADARLRLADVLDEARRHNPTIAAARERARAAASLPARARAWDDPVVSWEAWNAPDPFKVGQADNNIVKLAQKIPFPGKRTLAGRAAEGDADAATGAAGVVTLDVLNEVTRAYWDLWQAHHRLSIFERDQAVLERIVHIVEQRYGVSEVPQADVLRAQVERTHARTRVLTEQLAVESTGAALDALLSRTDDVPLGMPEEPVFPGLETTPETLVARALGQRPELAAQAATIAREEAALRLARKEYLPDFELAVGRFINYGARDGMGAMASMTIPLAAKAKYDAGVAEASARLASAGAERRRIEDLIRREVRQAYARVRSTLLQHDLLVHTHLPQAEQALRATEAAYQTGNVDFLALLESVRGIEDAHLDHIDAATETQKAWADLQRATGDTMVTP